jgi:hypothetical protein
MFYNNEDIGISKIEAYYKNIIEITSLDETITLYLGFNTKEYDVMKMEFNKRINIIEYLYWDVSLKVREGRHLFDITDNKVYLTRLDENKFRLEVDIDSPDMIDSNVDEIFNSLKVDAEFSFKDK